MFEAPNFTHVPNKLFDELLPTLKDGEMRVLLVVFRQTFGWHKDWDRIPISQLMKKTGLSKRGVLLAVNSLIEKKIVKKRKIGECGTQQVFYSLCVQEKEQNEPKIETNSNISDQYTKYTGTSILSIHSKETLTKDILKENITKESPPNPQRGRHTSFSEEAKQLVDFVQEKLIKQNPKAIPITQEKKSTDRKNAQLLLESLDKDLNKSLQIAKEVVERCFSDEFWKDKLVNVAYFRRKWNQLSQVNPKVRKENIVQTNLDLAKRFLELNKALSMANKIGLHHDANPKIGSYFEIVGKQNAVAYIPVTENGFLEQIYSNCHKLKLQFRKV